MAAPDAERVRKALASSLAAIRATACQPRRGCQSGQTESRENARRRGLVDIALCPVLFYTGLRRSEAAALAWGDIEASADGSGLLWVRRSKTDPEAEGSARYLPRRRWRRSRRSGRRRPVRRIPCSGSRSGRSAAAGGWKSAGMVIRNTWKETARNGAVAKYLEEWQDPPC